MVKDQRFSKTFVVFSTTVLLMLFLLSGLVNLAPVYADDGKTQVDNQGTPRIQVDRDYVDYGEIPLEQIVKHRTIIKNVGDAPLVIDDCHAGIIHTKALEGC